MTNDDLATVLEEVAKLMEGQLQFVQTCSDGNGVYMPHPGALARSIQDRAAELRPSPSSPEGGPTDLERLRLLSLDQPDHRDTIALDKAIAEIERLRRLEEAAKSGGSVPYGWYAAAVEDCSTAERARDEALRRVTVTDEMVERAKAAHDASVHWLWRDQWRDALTAALRGPT